MCKLKLVHQKYAHNSKKNMSLEIANGIGAPRILFVRHKKWDCMNTLVPTPLANTGSTLKPVMFCTCTNLS